MKLVAVEVADYNLRAITTPIGNIGETFDSFLTSKQTTEVPVRMRLRFPSSIACTLEELKKPNSIQRFLREATYIPKQHVFKAFNLTPVSNFKPLKVESKDFPYIPAMLEGNDLYVTTRKLAKLKSFDFAKNIYHVYSAGATMAPKEIIEARIYGMHALFPYYEQNDNLGVVVEIIHREEASEHHENFCLSDVYVLAANHLGIEVVDGSQTKMKQSPFSLDNITKFYRK